MSDFAVLLSKLIQLLAKASTRVSPSDGEDAASDILRKFLQRSDARQKILDHHAQIEAGRIPLWLRQDAISKAWEDRQKQRRLVPLENVTPDQEAHTPHAESEAIVQEFRESLPTNLQEMLALREAGLNQSEIAHKLDVSLRTVFSRMQQLRRHAIQSGLAVHSL